MAYGDKYGFTVSNIFVLSQEPLASSNQCVLTNHWMIFLKQANWFSHFKNFMKNDVNLRILVLAAIVFFRLDSIWQSSWQLETLTLSSLPTNDDWILSL